MNPLSFASRLAFARFSRTKGAVSLDVFSVLSYAVSTWILSTITAGTLMFYHRQQNPPEKMIQLMSGTGEMLESHEQSMQFAQDFLVIYIFLACFACGLVVVPIYILASGAARVGAESKERRFASLRLIGMTSTEITLIALVENLIQAVLGVALGFLVYGVSLPLWTNVTFTMQPIALGEMAMNWQGYGGVATAIIVISIVATIAGLHRVSITPLGVSRHHTPPALKSIRVLTFIGAGILFVAVVTYMRSQSTMTTAAILMVTGVVGMMTAVFLFAYYFVGAWVMQLVGRMFSQTANVSRLLAARRIVDNPRGTWRAQAALGIIVVILTVSTPMMIFKIGGEQIEDEAQRILQESFVHDLLIGETITLAIALILVAFSTLSSQASSLFGSDKQIQALAKMGIERKVLTRTRLYQMLIPLLFTIILGVITGIVLFLPFTTASMGEPTYNAAVVSLPIVLVIGIAVCLGTVFALTPLEKALYSEISRRND